MLSSFKSISLRVALVVALTATGFALAYWVSQSTAPVYPNAQARSSQFKNIAGSIRAASFGNSHNRALHFPTLQLKGFHRWWPGGDVFESLRAFEETAQGAENLEYAFVTVSPFSLDNGSVSAVQPGRANIRHKVYIEYQNFQPISYDWKIAVRAAVSPVARPDNWKGIVKVMLGQDVSVMTSSNGLPVRHEKIQLTHNKAEKSAKARSSHHVSLEEVSLSQNPDLCHDIEQAYQQIATIAQDENVQVILYTPPYMESYIARISESGDICQTGEVAEQLANDRKNVWYLDFRRDEAMSGDISLFRDSDHLDATGMRVFSSRLRIKLSEKGVLVN